MGGGTLNSKGTIMKYLLITAAALGLSACAAPTPLCDADLATWKWDKYQTSEEICREAEVRTLGHQPTGRVNEGGGAVPSPRTTDAVSDNPPRAEKPSKPPETSKPSKPSEPSKHGNPGNDKPVGKAGERPDGKSGWGDGTRGKSR